MSAQSNDAQAPYLDTLFNRLGILLCTRKNHELVEFALAGMYNTLFVSRYQVQLPGREEIKAFLHRAVQDLANG